MGEPLVDTHVHFFDLDGTDGLRWSWLDEVDPIHGDLGMIRARRFTPTELWAEGGRLGALAKCVHVQAALGTPDPVMETAWLADLRDAHGAPHAAVVHVHLEREDAIEQLERQLAHGNWVRGVRDPGKTRALLEPRYRAHVRRLAQEDLLFEIFCSPSRYADLAELARSCPDTQIVLEHFGLAPSPRDERFAGWRERLRTLAELPNVRLKLSGLGMVDRHWRFDDAAVLVAEGLEAFGVERCVLGSNWPIDRAASSYPDAIGALAAATADLSPPERRALFSANAEELYRL